ncbi:glutathione S-transferase N-terminal domain-containing protein [Piscirickettsia litoralis]|uniref:GST N-terminal domain-containing protein n=1 Tax=Piscirickettsia litoralis TaxID=1891921 RepID=A0ABX3A2X7_9GAMM|nr:glutathione S-transferase N-terminal domain-containing protein [Piscirickettsia litoralis]ODN41735.1 hypothetical protein BGC07_00465 [Piscirickettsia litoralis]
MPPILYSFRRCPFAIRARLALHIAGVTVELREVSLKNKPQTLLELSPKGTVPVLQLENGLVIDESLDIMTWALQQRDPESLLNYSPEQNQRAEHFLAQVPQLNSYIRRYKFINHHPETSEAQAKTALLKFLTQYEHALATHPYLTGPTSKLVDYALFPFIRQLMRHDSQWLIDINYQHLISWYKHFEQTHYFTTIMKKFNPWQPGNKAVYL